jgi:hypothetical protein
MPAIAELGQTFLEEVFLANAHHSIHFRAYRLRQLSGRQRQLRVSFVWT